MSIVIVGGGITGLATAFYLTHEPDGTPSPEPPSVILLEASPRLGGKVQTLDIAGRNVDVGAEAFLAVRPEGTALVAALGLDDDVVTPAISKVWIWTRGRLRPLPEGTLLGAPTSIRSVATSGVLGPLGLLRAGLEPLLPRRVGDTDADVATAVGGRFGRQVVDRLVEPLLGGVYAGSADRLSVRATAPMLATALDEHRSLVVGLGLRHRDQASSRRGGPVFFTLEGGLGMVVDALAEHVRDRVEVRTSTPVAGLDRVDGRWQMALDGGEIDADHVVLTTPAFVTADLVTRVAPRAAAVLREIPYASVAVITLAFPPEVGEHAPEGSGMLVPRTEGRLVKAATWISNKWPHHAGGDRWLVRCSVGRVDDRTPLELDDDVLVARVVTELDEAMGLGAVPLETHVTRWERSLPQYDVGHLDRVRAIRDALAVDAPGLHVAGAAYDGVGLAPCAGQAARLADVLRRS